MSAWREGVRDAGFHHYPGPLCVNPLPWEALQELRSSDGKSKTLIQRSWEAACAVAGNYHVVVATDDERIADCVRSFGGDVVMTSVSCSNGTERCADALRSLGYRPDVVVNLQGDAPMTPPWFVEALIDVMSKDSTASVATPVLRCDMQTLSHFLDDRKKWSGWWNYRSLWGRWPRALFFQGSDSLYLKS